MISMNNILLIATAFVAIVASPTSAKDYMVGDDSGWTINFDYQTWAQGKEFRVGDRLIFKYKEGAHNVHKVDGTGFQQCLPATTSVPLATANDVITLATPGRKWYICSVAKHCEVGGQKLVITVLPQLESPTPSPSAPTAAASDIAFSKYFSVMIAAFSLFLMIAV